MAFIKLRKANDQGEEVGTVFVNTDQILTISLDKTATEIQMSDGRPRWVKNSPDEVVALAQKST
jgi:hypothetical protein